MQEFMHDLVIDIGHLENGAAELYRSKFIQMSIDRRIVFINHGVLIIRHFKTLIRY